MNSYVIKQKSFIYEVYRKLLKHLNSDLKSVLSFDDMLECYKNRFGEAEYNEMCKYLKETEVIKEEKKED